MAGKSCYVLEQWHCEYRWWRQCGASSHSKCADENRPSFCDTH